VRNDHRRSGVHGQELGDRRPQLAGLDKANSSRRNIAGACSSSSSGFPRRTSPRCARSSTANLATALTDRYDRDGDPADLRQAAALFDSAIPLLRTDGRRVDMALHNQGMTYHEMARLDGHDALAELGRAIDRYRAALACPEPEPDERAGYLNSLGLSLRAKGLALADTANGVEALRGADTAYRAARELARPGGDNLGAATLNLAALLSDRAEAENDVGLLREAIGLYCDVLPTLDGPRRSRATTNLATTLVDLYRYSRDRAVLDDATRQLRESVAVLPSGPSRQVAQANLAAALHEMHTHTGVIALLDEAVAVQEELLAPPAPRPPERTLNLGVSLLARFRRRRVRADLDRAVTLFAETARRTSSAIERASALNSQANALYLRFDATGDRPDLDGCLRLREQAVASAPAGSVDVALYRANLGVDLLRRFELDSDDADLDRAVAEQRRAVREAPAGSTEQPRLLVGLADSLARRALRTRDEADATAARGAYREVIELGRASLPEQALGAAMRWGAWEADQQRWTQAAAAYERGLAVTTQLLGRQRLRADKQSWLLDALGLPIEACYAHVRAGDVAAAATALEHGRAMLLADALRLRRLTTRSVP
jgi:tetratricopeptide (TPR) repeat protein